MKYDPHILCEWNNLTREEQNVFYGKAAAVYDANNPKRYDNFEEEHYEITMAIFVTDLKESAIRRINQK